MTMTKELKLVKLKSGNIYTIESYREEGRVNFSLYEGRGILGKKEIGIVGNGELERYILGIINKQDERLREDPKLESITEVIIL